MGEKFEVNTVMVGKTAEKLRTINKNIKNDFSEVESAVRSLDSSWNSPAANAVIGKFYDAKNHYNDARYSVMDDFPKILMQVISADYEKTETTNKKLADAFK